VRRQLTLFVLAGLFTACQPQAAQKTAAATSVIASDTTRPVAIAKTGPPLPVLFAPADTLTPSMRKLLQTQDLSPLWQDLQPSAYTDRSIFEGFFGPDHYHFAMVFTQATRDATDPAVYHVAGKSRYSQSRNIRPFTGTITVRQVVDLSYPGFLEAIVYGEKKADNSLEGHTYTARARVQLQEDANENSGIFEGEALLDFYVVPDQKPGYVGVFAFEGTDDKLPTRGGGVLLRGNRRNTSTGQVKPFIVSPDVAAVAPYVFKDFLLDERMGEINPKYQHLGWNEYWTNEEWWADAPKPKLNM
jgi:hypothetical protein